MVDKREVFDGLETLAENETHAVKKMTAAACDAYNKALCALGAEAAELSYYPKGVIKRLIRTPKSAFLVCFEKRALSIAGFWAGVPIERLSFFFSPLTRDLMAKAIRLIHRKSDPTVYGYTLKIQKDQRGQGLGTLIRRAIIIWAQREGYRYYAAHSVNANFPKKGIFAAPMAGTCYFLLELCDSNGIPYLPEEILDRTRQPIEADAVYTGKLLLELKSNERYTLQIGKDAGNRIEIRDGKIFLNKLNLRRVFFEGNQYETLTDIFPTSNQGINLEMPLHRFSLFRLVYNWLLPFIPIRDRGGALQRLRVVSQKIYGYCQPLIERLRSSFLNHSIINPYDLVSDQGCLPLVVTIGSSALKPYPDQIFESCLLKCALSNDEAVGKEHLTIIKNLETNTIYVFVRDSDAFPEEQGKLTKVIKNGVTNGKISNSL